jgi:hypothetical protein
MKPKLIPVTKIDLDILNPRHDSSINTQEKIISHLVENDKIKKLAKDIADNGISPIDLIALVENEKGRFTVVEGNRRVCALTLLNRPNKSKTDSRYFKRLKEGSTKVPKEVECLIFDNRQQADIWIERKHSGEQDGRGTSAWDSEQKTRFNTRRGKSDANALAQTILDYATEKGFFSADTIKVLTTVTRYVSNPYLRNTFGIRSKSSNNVIELDVPTEQFDTVLQKFCEDIEAGDKISSRHNSKHIEAYAKEMVNQNLAPTTRVSEHTIEKTTTAAVLDVTTNNSGNKKDSSHPDSRKSVIPITFTARFNNDILRRIYGELKAIKVDEHPLSASLVCRVFLENVYERFHFSMIGCHNEMETHKRISKISDLIDADQNLTKLQRNSLAALRMVGSSKGNVFNPKALGANAHGAYYPKATELKAEWDNISLIVSYMLNKIYLPDDGQA